MPLLLVGLGNSYSGRFDLLGQTSDIDKAIEYTVMALALTPDDNSNLPGVLTNLGLYHSKRFQRLSEVGDSDKAIEYASLALASVRGENPDVAGMLANLGKHHGERFQHLGELYDLEKAIEYGSRALALTPDGHPNILGLLSNIGTSHSDRFERLGALSDLQQAIEYQSRALALAPIGYPHLPTILANIGVSFRHRFEQLGQQEDIENAIGHESRALALTPKGHSTIADRLHNLGISHTYRFRRLGELRDLQKGIEYQSCALGLTPDGHPYLANRLCDLGTAYGDRFMRLGELRDLEKEIEYKTRSLSLNSHGQPNMSSLLASLGVSFKSRFYRLCELDDLDKAIEYESWALALTPENHRDLADRLHNIGATHTHRFKHSNELCDIEKAVEYQTRALALTPNGHPHLPFRLYNLGFSHGLRFNHMGEEADIEKATEYMACALELTPDGHPSLPDRQFPLAMIRIHQYHQTGDLSHLQESLSLFQSATQSLTGSPREKFKYALGWARHSCHYSTLNCIEAYQTAINLLPQFIWIGATTDQRYIDLEQAQNLAVRAALAAILSSQYALALEWLEHARCVVWNQSLMLRSPLDELYSYDPALATRVQTITTQLHRASSESRESQVLSSGSLILEQVAQNHHRLAQEYNDLISQVRTLPRFGEFLLPIKAERLVSAARNGPIVIINCHEDRCDALIITPGRDQILHIPLLNFSGKKAQLARSEMERTVRSSRLSERGAERRPVLEQTLEFEGVLAILWYDVVKPILDSMGYTNQVSNDDLPHITWCPTGALSFLPLHAAGDYNQPQSRVFDYVVSSYTPTLTALLSTIPSSLARHSRVLAIAQPNTPGHSSLPGTLKELKFLKDHTSNKAEYSQLVGDQATTIAVLEAMEHHDWVHLACHAHQNVQDPTKSGVFLHNDILDLASINQRSFKNTRKGLAYLSACQTATGDENLPDEAIHLASGMLMAGYSSVIATMWSVMDDDAPFVADKVYSELMKEGKVGTGEAGKALHYAVGELRDKIGEKEFARWVPYIHVGS